VTGVPASAHFRGRGVVVGLLIGVASLMVIVSILSIWLNTVVYDTPTWRATSQEIIHDPAMQRQVSQYVVNELYNSAAIQNDISGALPPKFQNIAPAVTSGLRQVAVQAAERLLATTQVQNLWVEASVKAHDAFVRLIDNQTKFAQLNNGKIVLDLHPVLLQVADTAGLGAAAQRLLPASAGQLDIMTTTQLSTLQTAARILHALSIWAPVIVVVLLALAIWLADGFRRRTLLWSAIGILLATLILVVVRRILGTEIVDSLAGNVAARPALINAWYIATDRLGTTNLTVLVGAIVLVVGAWLAGAGRLRSEVHRRLAPWIINPLSAFGIPAVVLVVLVVWGPLPVFQKWIPVVVIAVLAALGIQALRLLAIAERSGRSST
jgi:hypothetical protein